MKMIKVLDLLEARVLTGPAKNILRFAADCRHIVDLTIATFVRVSQKTSSAVSSNEFISAARSKEIPVEVISETGRFDVSVLATLRQICEQHKPDIVQTHGTKSHFLVSLLGRRPFTWLAFHHGYTDEDLKVRLYNQLDRWSLRTCDFTVTVSHEFAKRLVGRSARRDRIFVVPNAVQHEIYHPDVKRSEEARQKLNLSPDELVVVAIGRLSPEKGHRYLIDAVAKINSTAPQMNLQVLIAGEGPSGVQLKRQIDKLGLAHKIRMMGYCSDIKPLLSVADLFVLPSLSEGSPNALLESMAASVPIVATNVGGVPELVDDGESAVLVPAANAEILGKSILELLQDGPRSRQLASVASDRARLMFTPAKYDERILNIYHKVLRDTKNGNVNI
jgi:glycosyltransferase involved in cell wall biosynthesis